MLPVCHPGHIDGADIVVTDKSHVKMRRLPHSFPSRFSSTAATRLPAWVLWAAVSLGAPAAGLAHGDLDAQIETVSRQIDQAPSATLYLKRGELRHDHEDFDAALADYDRAARLNPEMDAVWLARGRTLFMSGRLQPAREALDVYLKRKPGHAEGFLLRARILAGLKEHAGAVRDYDRNLELTPQPLPECFIERSESLVALGENSAAVKSLDEGLGRLGNLTTLQSAAVVIELAQKHYDAALARVDRVMADLRRKETWLMRRGDILEAAGRREEALRAYGEALAALEQLPAHHRNVKPMQELEARLRRLLGT